MDCKNENNSPESMLITTGNTSMKKVAITYDLGFKDSEAASILSVLERHKVRCTFFLTGLWAEKYGDLSRRIIREGHEIGNHSYDHPDMCKITYAEKLKTIRDGEEAILRATGVNPRPLLRHPYGSWDREVLAAAGEAGYKYSIYWSKDSLDWQLPDTQAIINRILYKISNGDIVLCHAGSKNTAAATQAVIENLKARGYETVKVSELLT